MFGVFHKPPEYNSPSAPPYGWSGGTLDKPWTYPGTIDTLPDLIFDQARLSKSVSRGSAAGSRCQALNVGCVNDDGYLAGPPELIVEVAASSASIDLRDKRRAYCRNGVREYLVWLVAEARLE